MDPRLLDHYNTELRHLREMGMEFAQHFPKIAGRLSMNGLEVADPYVERLLEGVSFLAARVQLKLEAEFPRFTQALLEIVYPHYLAPTPSMLVAQFTPESDDPNLASGFKKVPRGTTLQGALPADHVTRCEFRTAHDVTLWPIEVVSASYFSFAPDLALNTLPVAQNIKGGVRIRLRATAGLTFARTAIDRLCFYLAGADDVANKLYELCAGNAVGVLVGPPASATGPRDFLTAAHIRPVGFEEDEALLPVTLRSFHGYRLLQEYFTFPERYRFFEVRGLAPALRRSDGNEIELVVLLGRGEPTFESVVDKSNFALFCTPAINLFEKRADRVQITGSTHEFHINADRTRPLDFEIYKVTEVLGHGAGEDSEQRFLPLYAAHSSDRRNEQAAYFTTRREPRLPSSSQKRRGSRSSYIGTEVFLSLVDPLDAPFRGDLRQLSIKAECTNRDLALQMPVGGSQTDLSLEIAAPVKSIRVITGPTRPHAPLTDGAVSWRAINHLSLNYLSLVDATPQKGAASLRDLLELYAPDGGDKKQIDGIQSMKVQPVVRRLRVPGPLAFGRGLELSLLVDEMAFEGGSAYLLGAVLARYFARHVSMNSFTETILRSETRGEIGRWMPQWGARPTL
jgi:type VI secretion system protein ImpG